MIHPLKSGPTASEKTIKFSETRFYRKKYINATTIIQLNKKNTMANSRIMASASIPALM
jgi:hypothetical protein